MRFTFANVRLQAAELASRPFEDSIDTLPPGLRNLSYDQYRDIRFRPEKALWQAEGLPFKVQFFQRASFSFMSAFKKVTVHTIDCDTLSNFQDSPERWVDIAWDVSDESPVHTGRLQLVVANEPGCLGSLSTLIGKNNGNISNLKITNRSPDFFEMLIDVQVVDTKHLSNIIAALRTMPVITNVERARG